ncbi:MAG: restriction endonuclease [Bacteroidota bacterium]
MKIIDAVPASWKDLQNKVGRILEECGFVVEVEYSMTAVRGKIEVDVYARETIDSREYLIACECKHWKDNIPRAIIQSFKTDVAELGCNKGYIITTSKFQSGAISAAEKTNVELITWEKFQEIFFESWYAKYFSVEIRKIMPFNLNYNWIDWFDDLDKEDKQQYGIMKNKLGDIDDIISNFPMGVMKELNMKFYEIPELPLLGNRIDPEEYAGEVPTDILEIRSYREFLDKFTEYAKPFVVEFQKLEEKYQSSK